MSDLVSIIVPVYNVEKYVSECLESIQTQTYKNLEVIVVNDGSTDSSLDICLKVCSGDNRFHIYSKRNGGLSDARNFGMSKASGNLLTFIDSDDYVEPSYIETLVQTLHFTDSDIACCGFQRVDDLKKCLKLCSTTDTIVRLNRKEAMLELVNENKVKTQAWGKIFKKNLFNDLEFPYGKYHEDIYVMHRLIDKANSVGLSPKVLYDYRYNSNSITGGAFNVKRQEAVDAMQLRLEFVNTYYPEFEKDQIKQLVWTCCYVNFLIFKSRKVKAFRDIFKTNQMTIEKYFNDFIRSNASLKSKVFAIFCMIWKV